jgi:hypothetical protein
MVASQALLVDPPGGAGAELIRLVDPAAGSLMVMIAQGTPRQERHGERSRVPVRPSIP